jgi:O-antigen/teichoic acid export membrane protein
VRHLSGTRLLGSTGVLVSGRFAGALLGLATQAILARYLGADLLGLFFIATSLASVLSVFLAMGYPSVVQRYVGRYENRNRKTWLASYLISAQRDIFLASAVVLVPGALLIIAGTSPGDARLTLMIAGLMAPFLALSRLLSALANARKRFFLAFLPTILFRPTVLFLLVVVLALVNSLNQVSTIVAADFFIALLIFLNLFMIFQGELSRARQAVKSSSAKGRQIGLWRKNAMTLTINALFSAFFADLAILIASLFLSSADTAVFSLCLKIAMLLGFSIQAVHQIMLPGLSEAHEQKALAELKARLSQCNRLALAASIGGVLFVLVFGKPILALFGPEFEQGYTVLAALCFAQILRALGGPAMQLLTLSGHSADVARISAFGILLLFLANVGLAMLFGLAGAAMAIITVVGVIVMIAAFRVYSRLHYCSFALV